MDAAVPQTLVGPPLSAQQDRIRRAMAPFVGFFTESAWALRRGTPGIADFVAGNPQEMPLDGVVEAIREAAVPRDAEWYAYKLNERVATEAVAASLRARLRLPFEPDDVFMTRGAWGALAIALHTVVSPGDEVIFVTPPWFFYEAMIEGAHAVPVRVPAHRATFDLDVDAIEAAITSATRAVIVNSPNNPTGRIYPPETLARLAEVLSRASRRTGRRIFLLSDEAYSRIVYDGRECPSPAAFYPDSFLVYTYGKTLLIPGQRLGYLALPPDMPGRQEMRSALTVTQLTGFGVPDAVMQYATPRLERLSIDVSRLQARRDRMTGALREQGYDVHVPEATFYLLPRSPLEDDAAFATTLAERDVFVLPGHVVEMPGTFRISLTASDEMVEQALPVFAWAAASARREG